MSVTATTAPARNKHNQFAVTKVEYSGAGHAVSVAVSDSAGNAVGTFVLTHTGTMWQGLAYASNNELAQFTVAAPGGSAALDFAAYADTPGAHGPRALAVEARFVATGRLPT